jgi:hypothetical protein
MADITRLDEAEIFDAGMNPAPKRYLEIRDGEEIIHKPTQGPYEKWVNKDGVVMGARMTTGAALFDTDGPYAARKRRTLRGNKCIPYAECPLRHPEDAKYLTSKSQKENPCDPATYGKAKACKHVEEIIKTRAERNSAEWREKELKFMSMSDIQKKEWLERELGERG